MNRFFIIIAFAFLLSSCTSQKSALKDSAGNTVLIYGSKSCGACVSLKKSLDKEKIKYTFYDINEDKKYYNKMMKLGKKAVNYYTIIYYPVVKINNTIIMRPSVEEIKNQLK